MERKKSEILYKQALKLFPGGVNSPVRAFKSVFGTPIFIDRGEGAYIWDVDDNKYLDFCCSWGPLILGHKHPKVIEAIDEAVHKGTTFGAPCQYGIDLAEQIIENNRFIEKIRFVSSGTEAVMSAVRLARGVTGKSKVIKFEGCYHGHVDHLMVKAGSGLVTFGESSSAGVPEAFARETIVMPLNDENAVKEAFEKHGADIACIILEPIPANNGLLLQDKSYLQFLKDICKANGVLLIFDEVISGFRIQFDGAAGYYDVAPDIVTYGKVVGGGMPVGAFGASNEIMSHIAPDGPVYQAGTLSANPVAMAAGAAQIRECLTEGFYENLNAKTKRFTDGINAFCEKNDYPIRFSQMGSIFWMAFSTERINEASKIDASKMAYYKEIHKQLLNRNVYFAPSGYEVGFISQAHTNADLDMASQALFDSIQIAFTR